MPKNEELLKPIDGLEEEVAKEKGNNEVKKIFKKAEIKQQNTDNVYELRQTLAEFATSVISNMKNINVQSLDANKLNIIKCMAEIAEKIK